MSGRLPTWLADWLGIEAASLDEAAIWQLDSAWSWAPWATLLLILGATLWTVLLYARESSAAALWYRGLLAGLRLVAIALLLVMIAQWAIALRLTGPPTLALVIDRSGSMSLTDRYEDTALHATLSDGLRQLGLDEPTRINLAKLLLLRDDGRLLDELASRYRLETYFVAGGIDRRPHTVDSVGATETVRAIRELSADGPDSTATRLGDAVRHVLDSAATTPAAIVLLTDGIATEGAPLASAAAEARRKRVPIFAVGLGSDQPPRRIELSDVLVDDAVFVDDLVNFQLQIRSSGLEGAAARVVLRRNDEPQPVAEEEITLGPSGETQIAQLLDRPTEPGDVTYLIEVKPRDDEIDLENSRQERTIAVRDEKIRVLVAFAYPSYEYRFLKSLLERDASIELATFLQEADPDHADQDKSALRAFPVGRDELLDFDVVLFGDLDPRLVPRSVWANLRTFVAERGGGVAFIAGERYMPWRYHNNPDVAALLPIVVDAGGPPTTYTPTDSVRSIAIHPTPLGLRSPALQLGDSPDATERIWHRLAPQFWLAPVAGLKPAAHVLAEVPGLRTAGDAQSAIRNPQSATPAIVFHYVGAGRVLFHAIDSTWRWRMGAGEIYFARYWVQMIRHLARGSIATGRGAELIADRREYQRGDDAELRVRFFDQRLAPAGGEDVTVLVETPHEATRRITLHRNPAADGTYQGSIADLSEGDFQVLLAEPQLEGSPPATQFSVVAPPGEFARTTMDQAELAGAADTTRGRFYTIADANGLVDDLPPGRRVPLENLPPLSIWNQWWLLAAFAACLTTEWLLRKRKGML